MTVKIIQGDARESLACLPEEWYHCCVTSPPYWALRSYLKADDPLKELELGSESTPEEHVAAMVGVFDGVRRVLRSDGLLWVNYGDSYNGYMANQYGTSLAAHAQHARPVFDSGREKRTNGLCSLDRVGIPERFALAMQQAGWIWRDVVIWRKLSAMPESVNGTRWERCRVKISPAARGSEDYRVGSYSERPNADHNGDSFSQATYSDCPGCPKCSPNGGYVLRRGSWRTTRSHEVIFLFAKSPNYFADAEAIKEPCETATVEREKYTRVLDDPEEQFAVKHNHESISGGKRNPRSVRVFKGEPLKAAHYAAYPTALPAWCITASTSQKGCCPTCGAQWAPVVDNHFMPMQYSCGITEQRGVNVESRTDQRMPGANSSNVTAHRPTCDCPPHEPIRPRVLDPFGGSGSTAIAATKLCCDCTLLELNPKYIELAWKRIKETAGLFA